MTEILTHIKMIKLYCWEKSFAKVVSGKYMKMNKNYGRRKYYQEHKDYISCIFCCFYFVSHSSSGVPYATEGWHGTDDELVRISDDPRVGGSPHVCGSHTQWQRSRLNAG